MDWKWEAERLLYDLGKQVLGQNSGGVIKKLIELRGFGDARMAIKAAAMKSDPREYIGAVLKEKADGSIRAVKAGEIIDGWQWTGGRWKQLEA